MIREAFDDYEEISIMFDVNPVPYGNELALNVSESDNRISIDLALSVASKFGIDNNHADKIASDIVAAVKENWERIARGSGLSRRQIDYMRPAFADLRDE